MSEAPRKRRYPFRGIPVRTTTLNLVLIVTIFVTRDRWGAWRLTTDLAHVPAVSHLAVTSDRERVALVSHAGDDAFCHVYDAKTGGKVASSRIGPSKLLDPAVPVGGFVPRAMISPDGSSFIVLGGRGPVSRMPVPRTGAETRVPFVVDSRTGERICTLGGHALDVTWAAYSPDGKRVVTAAIDPDARVWDARTGECLLVLSGHRYYILHAEFSPDGRRILTHGNDRTTRVWDAETGRQLALIEKAGEDVIHALFCRGGERVLTWRADDRLGLFDAGTARSVTVLRGSYSFATHPGGRELATADDSGVVRVWSLEDGSLGARLGSSGRGFRHFHLQYLPDGRRLMAASPDASVTVWDVRSGQCVFAVRVEDLPVRLTPDGRRIVCPGAVYDASNGRLLARAPEWEYGEVIDDERLLVMRGHEGVGIVARVRPEAWWGVLWLPHFWVTAALAVALAWSVWRDLRKFSGADERDDEGD